MILKIFFCLFFVIASVQSRSCECEEPDLCSAVQTHEFVLKGTVKSVSNADPIKYNVQVVTSFKEKLPDKITVFADPDDPCLKSLNKKETYLLFLIQKGKDYWLSSCWNTKWSSLSDSEIDLVKKCSKMCPPTCQMFCPTGYVLDKNGCPICECQDCPDGTAPVQCFAEPCSLQSTQCPEAHTCINDYCGGCFAHYFDSDGKAICPSCPDVMCAIACEYGYIKDDNGCPTCKCMPKPVCGDGTEPVACFQDPCSSNSCPEAATCVADYCGGCKAHYYDSTGKPIEHCGSKCDPVTCTLFCEYGYQRDDNGCLLCACQPPPVCTDGTQPVDCIRNPCDSMSVDCPAAETCVPDYCGGCNAHYYNAKGKQVCECPPMMCAIACQYGYVVDDNGCSTCSCKPPPVCGNGKPPVPCFEDPCASMSSVCPEATTCVTDYCGGCTPHYQDSKGNEICKCPPVLCEIACENGFKKDKKGCPICECAPPVCANGKEPVACFTNPCHSPTSECPQATKCVPDYCGGCITHYYDSNGSEICILCEPPVCDKECKHGRKTDPVTGCETCECKDAML